VIDVGTMLDQQIDDFIVAFPNSVVERQLVQLVLGLWIDTLLDKEGDKTQGNILILDSTSLK
jgi:hypothetical protein